MTLTDFFKNNLILKRYYIKLLLIIAIIWAVYDYSRFISLTYSEALTDYPYSEISQPISTIKIIISLIGHGFMAYLLIFPLKNKLRKYPVWINFIVKTLVLCICTALLALFYFYIIYLFVYGKSLISTSQLFFYYSFKTNWLLTNITNPLLIYIITLLCLEINEKYSPGVFTDIFVGKYVNPKEENRIIMFIDLKNSTPIAEKLGHKKYFFFIRDFIHHISMALLEYDGLIYQYVGDEIVVSWIQNKTNNNKSIQSLLKARKLIEKDSIYYRNNYDTLPEFRVGIHVGIVTVGEIGIVKKDLAISGDAMNTAARIRSMSSELNQKFVVSADFVNSVGLKDWQVESLGSIELKGKGIPMELFALKI